MESSQHPVGAHRQFSMPRVLVAGTCASSATRSLMLGLLVALKRAELSVSAVNIGPSLVQPTHQRRISSHLAHTLDPWLLSTEQCVDVLVRASSGAEIMVLHAESGLFDTIGEDSTSNTVAALARMMKVPVILVVDASGIEEGIGALVKGFHGYHPDFRLAGVILVHVKDRAHTERLRSVIQFDTGLPVIGGIPRERLEEIEFAKGDDNIANPSLLPRTALVAIGKVVTEELSIATFREIAERAATIEVNVSASAANTRACRKAVADDAAFHLTIQDNLDLVRRFGGELVKFSPLSDQRLPDRTAGIYLSGGYVEQYASDLKNNHQIIHAIQEFVSGGGVLYAEGSASAYLCDRVILPQGESADMVGIIHGTARAMNSYLTEQMEYCEVLSVEETVCSSYGDTFRGLLDPRWNFHLREEMSRCFHIVKRNHLSTTQRNHTIPIVSGFSPVQNVIASPVYAHWGSRPKMAEMFMELASVFASAHGLHKTAT